MRTVQYDLRPRCTQLSSITMIINCKYHDYTLCLAKNSIFLCFENKMIMSKHFWGCFFSKLKVEQITIFGTYQSWVPSVGFAKSRPAAHGPRRPSGPKAHRPAARARDGPAARRPRGLEARCPGFLSNGKSTRMHRSASGLGVQNGRQRV